MEFKENLFLLITSGFGTLAPFWQMYPALHCSVGSSVPKKELIS